MSKLLLRFTTNMGPRTIVSEITDDLAARAALNSHLALGEYGELVDESPRMSLRDHMAKHRRAMARSKIKVVSTRPSNVTPLRKGARP